MTTFPFDVWGEVRPTPAAGRIERIMVERMPGGGYLLFTLENGSVYDTWIETLEEVEADLRALDIEWPPDLSADAKRPPST